MDPLKAIRKIKKGEKPKKNFEFRLKINLWKILITAMLVIFFVPFIISFFQLQGSGSRIDTSQAVQDIREDKIKEVAVQDAKMILIYKDGNIKIATKEDGQNFADLLDKSKVDTSKIKYNVVDQSLSKAF